MSEVEKESNADLRLRCLGGEEVLEHASSRPRSSVDDIDIPSALLWALCIFVFPLQHHWDSELCRVRERPRPENEIGLIRHANHWPREPLAP